MGIRAPVNNIHTGPVIYPHTSTSDDGLKTPQAATRSTQQTSILHIFLSIQIPNTPTSKQREHNETCYAMECDGRNALLLSTLIRTVCFWDAPVASHSQDAMRVRKWHGEAAAEEIVVPLVAHHPGLATNHIKQENAWPSHAPFEGFGFLSRCSRIQCTPPPQHHHPFVQSLSVHNNCCHVV